MNSIFKNFSLYAVIFLFIISLSSCCITQNDSADIKQTAQNFPSTVNANQSFDLTFTVQSFSTGDCSAETTNSGNVQLMMVNRKTGHVQVNDFENLNELDSDEAQTFVFRVNIGTAGTYDLSFIIDPNHTTGDANPDNNTYTSVVIVN